jgi:hypothetical protein
MPPVAVALTAIQATDVVHIGHMARSLFRSTFSGALLPSLSFGPFLDVTQLMGPVPLERLHPVMDWLQLGRIQFVHAVLSALYHRYHADFT